MIYYNTVMYIYTYYYMILNILCLTQFVTSFTLHEL